MDDIREIEQFLIKIKESSKAGLIISPNMVYSNLKYLGRRVVNDSRISDNFSDWINYFRNVNNINVFVQDNWRYFCQFVNDDYKAITPHNMIKMYIPVDDNHINEAAKRIFDFISKNKMIHHSKIGSEVRFDDIVIRIDSEENAKKIEEFVMNDPYIKEGLMKANPFAFNNGYISYAWDGELSFNYTIAAYISNYINEKKKENKLDDVSYKDFVAYVGKIYQAVFKEGKYKDDYINAMEVDDISQLENYKKVTELLLQSIMPDKKDKDFYSVYNKIVFDKEEKDNDVKVFISEKQQARWNQIYDYLVHKYGCYEADVRIFKFLETNNYNYFTRDNDIRGYLINNRITKEMIQEMYLANDKRKDNRKILVDASCDTYQKYGYRQICVALGNASIGNYKYFTNDNGNRDRMKESIKQDEIYGLIISYYLEKGYDIKDIPLDDMNKLYSEYINLIENSNKNKYQR